MSVPTAGPFPDEVLRQLAERFDTPLYVYDLDLVERQVGALRAVLPSVVDLAFAVKANPALGVVGFLGGLGVGADVASGGELATALRAGIAPGRIVMTGPGKRDAELRRAVGAGIRAITVESPGELERLERIAAAERVARPVPILLRASTAGPPWSVRRAGVSGSASDVAIDDGAGKFGMDATDLVACARQAVRSPRLELLGLHAFGWSNVLDADLLADHVETTVRAAVALAREVGIVLGLVDAGGGLGIPYAAGEAPLDLDRLGRRLGAIVARWPDDPLTDRARLLLEPGRFLVGEAGRYVASVVDAKTVGGRRTIVLDGGIHHLLRPALVGREHRLRLVPGDAAEPAGARSAGTVEPTTVAGPLCTGLDLLGRSVELAPAEPGDLVEVGDVGAYGFTESMPLFLSHPMPAEIAVRHGRVELLRPRLEPEMWLEGQRLAGADGATMADARLQEADLMHTT